MEKIKRIIASLVLGILSLPYTLMAQDEGSYIENLGVQDSSYMEEGNPLPSGGGTTEAAAGSGTTVAIIIAAVVIIAMVVFFIIRKKKK